MATSNLAVKQITLSTPFGVGPVNVYLIKDDPITLVDAGPNLPEAEAQVTEVLRKEGLGFPDVKRLILTHGHPDHIGLADRIRELSGAEVFLHEAEVARLTSHNPQGTERARLLLEAGIPPHVVAELAKYNLETRQGVGRIPPIRLIKPLNGEEVFGFASGELRVLYTPGHSPGHICLYNPRSECLFSGDHVLPDISPSPLLEETPDGRARAKSLGDYLNSMRKVSDLEPAVVYPGHGAPFLNYREVLNRFTLHFRKREQAVLNLVGTEPVSAYDIACGLYPGVKGVDIYLAVSKVIGHLDILADSGEVSATVSNGVVKFNK